MVFEYTGDTCDATTNEQEGKKRKSGRRGTRNGGAPPLNDWLLEGIADATSTLDCT